MQQSIILHDQASHLVEINIPKRRFPFSNKYGRPDCIAILPYGTWWFWRVCFSIAGVDCGSTDNTSNETENSSSRAAIIKFDNLFSLGLLNEIELIILEEISCENVFNCVKIIKDNMQITLFIFC